MHAPPGHVQNARVFNRPRAWTLKGLKPAVSAIFLRGVRYSTLAAMWTGGILGNPFVIRGAANAETFLEWFKRGVVSAIMDACSPSLLAWCIALHHTRHQRMLVDMISS
jgi:hypothetical protein